MHANTLSIDDDIPRGARQIADLRGQTLGKALSELARASLTRASGGSSRNGVLLLPLNDDAGRATLEEVNALRDNA